MLRPAVRKIPFRRGRGVSNHKNPNARLGVARSLACSCTTDSHSWKSFGLQCSKHERDFLLEDMKAQNAERDDTHQHLHYVDVANRTLRRVMGAHPPNRAKAWQTQVALVTHSDHEPRARKPRWGVIATVMIWQPEEHGDPYCAAKCWALTWREAIELAVAQTLDT